LTVILNAMKVGRAAVGFNFGGWLIRRGKRTSSSLAYPQPSGDLPC
jgi:hypothetical protein